MNRKIEALQEAAASKVRESAERVEVAPRKKMITRTDSYLKSAVTLPMCSLPTSTV